jgi:cell division septum initiation protein DivIVA
VRGSRDDDDLIPLHQPFERALRGFNRRQVLEYLDTLDGRIAMVAADRDAALTQVAELSKVLNHLRLESELLEHLRREADNAKSQVEHILATPMAEANARIQRIMRLAEQEAAEIKAQAEAETAARIAHVDQDIAELRARADDQITGLRARVSREAKSLLVHARRQCTQLETDSAARREAAEQDSAQAIAHRESTADAQIRDSELRSIARMHLILQVISEQLATRVGAVERDESALHELRAQVAGEVTALETLRTDVTAAVAATHQFLTEALGQIHKTTDEHPADRTHPVPIQRNAEGGAVYRLNAGADNRRSPRAPS